MKYEIEPIKRTLDLINRKWTIIIIRDMFLGKKHFSEFKQGKPSLNNNVLTDTLKFMENEELIIKQSDNNTTSYSLTNKSKKLNKVFYEMLKYSLDEIYAEEYNETVKQELLTKHATMLNISL